MTVMNVMYTAGDICTALGDLLMYRHRGQWTEAARSAETIRQKAWELEQYFIQVEKGEDDGV